MSQYHASYWATINTCTSKDANGDVTHTKMFIWVHDIKAKWMAICRTVSTWWMLYIYISYLMVNELESNTKILVYH